MPSVTSHKQSKTEKAITRFQRKYNLTTMEVSEYRRALYMEDYNDHDGARVLRGLVDEVFERITKCRPNAVTLEDGK